jgi:hypothetical protein
MNWAPTAASALAHTMISTMHGSKAGLGLMPLFSLGIECIFISILLLCVGEHVRGKHSLFESYRPGTVIHETSTDTLNFLQII